MARGAALCAIAAASALALAALSGASASAVPAGNLVQNPGAESVRAASTGPQKPAGWSAGSGFTVQAYGAAGSPAAPAGGGANFFSGPPVDSPYNALGAALDNGGWDATQPVAVSGAAAEIDAGSVKATFSVLMGGFQGVAGATATFKDAAGADLGSISLGPGTAHAMTPFTATKAVPAKTRTIVIRLAEHRADQNVGGFGFFDNVSLTLSGGTKPSTTTAPPTSDPIEGTWIFDRNVVVISRSGAAGHFAGVVTKPAAGSCYARGQTVWTIIRAGANHYTGTHLSHHKDCSPDPNYPAVWDLLTVNGKTVLRICVTAKDGYKACESLSRAGTGDTTLPKVKALASSGRAGTWVRLRYQVSDDSGTTREEIKVYKGSTVTSSTKTSFGQSLPGHTYYIRWRAPASAVGSLRFCIRSFDRAGNVSPTSCAPLQLSR